MNKLKKMISKIFDEAVKETFQELIDESVDIEKPTLEELLKQIKLIDNKINDLRKEMVGRTISPLQQYVNKF